MAWVGLAGIGLLGWVLGVIGHVRAGRALRETAALRGSVDVLVRRQIELGRLLEARGAAAAVPDAPVPATTMPAAPMPEVEPAPVEVAAEAPEAERSAAPPPRVDLETLLTQRWGVWVGSVALMLAGVFLVRYAMEQGWLGPTVRCVAGFMLGGALLVAAEWLLRHPAPALAGPFGVDQAPAGLAAGGVAVLFGAAYGVGVFYALVPPGVGFALMAAAALAGLAAALRFGPLTAAVGVACAYLTPALVDSEAPSLPGLFAYLLVVTAASWAVVRQTAWIWLGWAATACGAAWLVVVAGWGVGEMWAPAGFVVLGSALNIWLLPGAALDHETGRWLAWVPPGALMVAGLVLASAHPGWETRAAVFALSGLAVAKAARVPRLERLPGLAASGGLLGLLGWALPAWGPTDEVIRIEGRVQAIFPGVWAPGALQPLLLWAAGFAAFHAGCGLWFERRRRWPLTWSALPASVPVLVLVVVYAQVGGLWPDLGWAALALALAAGLTGTAAAALRGAGWLAAGRQVAGVHAAGAVAALVLGGCFLLHDHWLTLAFALMLPGLAWVEDQAGLPALRPVALAVAGLVLARLMLNWHVLGYGFGLWPVLNGLVAAYAVPAAAFAVAAVMFSRGRDDLLVRILESGAILLAASFVVLEIRHAVTGGALRDQGRFAEAAIDVLGLAVQAWAYRVAAERTERAVLGIAWRILGGLALLGGGVLLLANPAVTDAEAGVGSLLCGYLLPGAIAAWMARGMTGQVAMAMRLYALAAGFVWIGLQVRWLFHPTAMAAAEVADAELWSWSGAWLVYGLGLLAAGVWLRDRGMRLAGLAIVALVSAKVFLFDMAGLAGLWRVVSFLGLGLVLIGLGAAYRRFGMGLEPEGGSADHPG